MKKIKNLIYVFIALLSLHASAIEFGEVPWADGQVIGISTRSGMTPILVQGGGGSAVDHVGLIFQNQGIYYIYEYTTATSIQIIPLKEAWDRSKDSQGVVNFVLAEFTPPLTATEIEIVKERFNKWIEQKEAAKSHLPETCADAVAESLKGIREIKIQTISKPVWLSKVLDGLLERFVDRAYKGKILFPAIDSVFTNLRRVYGNLPTSLRWSSSSEFMKAWTETGDFSKLARWIALESRVRLNSPKEVLEYTGEVRRRLQKDISQLQKVSCKSTLVRPML